jgi:hypothetical protein
MDKLWEDHITWTRMVIVDFAAGLPDLRTAEARLLRNQVDIGNAIKPYYGRAAGNQLTNCCALTSSKRSPCSKLVQVACMPRRYARADAGASSEGRIRPATHRRFVLRLG